MNSLDFKGLYLKAPPPHPLLLLPKAAIIIGSCKIQYLTKMYCIPSPKMYCIPSPSTLEGGFDLHQGEDFMVGEGGPVAMNVRLLMCSLVTLPIIVC